MSGDTPGGSVNLASAGPLPRSFSPESPETDTRLALDIAESLLRGHVRVCAKCETDAPACEDGFYYFQRVCDLQDELNAEAQVATREVVGT